MGIIPYTRNVCSQNQPGSRLSGRDKRQQALSVIIECRLMVFTLHDCRISRILRYVVTRNDAGCGEL